MIDPTDLLLIIAALRERGFYRSAERLVAPNGTLWLSRPMLGVCAIDTLRIESERRLKRTLGDRHLFRSAYDWQSAVEDAESLLTAIEMACESRATAGLAKAS